MDVKESDKFLLQLSKMYDDGKLVISIDKQKDLLWKAFELGQDYENSLLIEKKSATNYEDVSSQAKSTKCFCPRCEKIHYKQIFWTGRGLPRIRCESCKAVVKGDGLPELDEHSMSRNIQNKV